MVVGDVCGFGRARPVGLTAQAPWSASRQRAGSDALVARTARAWMFGMVSWVERRRRYGPDHRMAVATPRAENPGAREDRTHRSVASQRQVAYKRSPDLAMAETARRGARVVDWDGLENRCTLTGTEGSNPSLSANAQEFEQPRYLARGSVTTSASHKWSPPNCRDRSRLCVVQRGVFESKCRRPTAPIISSFQGRRIHRSVLMTPLIFDSCITMPKQARLSWTPLFVSGWVT